MEVQTAVIVIQGVAIAFLLAAGIVQSRLYKRRLDSLSESIHRIQSSFEDVLESAREFQTIATRLDDERHALLVKIKAAVDTLGPVLYGSEYDALKGADIGLVAKEAVHTIIRLRHIIREDGPK